MGGLLNRDIIILFITKILRMFSFGALSVVFFNVLASKGIEEQQIGFLQSFVAFGDIVISLILTTRADKIGRKKTLILGAFLKFFAGIVYAVSDNYIMLIISGALGVLTVSGGEIGPFLPIEQAAIAHIVEENTATEEEMKEDVTRAYGYYNMASYLSQASGNVACGVYISWAVDHFGGQREDYFIQIVYMYAAFGLLKGFAYCLLSNHIEADPEKRIAK